MKRMFLILIICTMTVGVQTTIFSPLPSYARGKKIKNEAVLTVQDLKKELDRIIQDPYTVDIADNSITVNFPTVSSTSDDFFKNKLFSIASLLVTSNLSKEVIISTWKDLNSNYIYKSAVLKDDIDEYNKAKITFNNLFTRIKIVKSEVNREDTKLQQTPDFSEDNTKLTLSPLSKMKEETKPVQTIELKPKKDLESLYTPILKPLIHNDFDVEAKDSYVIISIWTKPSEDEEAIKNSAYNIFRAIMGVNPSLAKIVIYWQQEKGDFGKSASLAGIYIKDFFRKKITQKELQEVIQIVSLEPESTHMNKVEAMAKLDVPIENLRKSQELRKAADIYRQNQNLDSAIRTYKRALKFNPNDYLSHYWIGEIYIQKNNLKLAKKHLNKSLGLNPGFRQADKALANITIK